jgi:ribosomal protein L16 Arg81 hydroxylase
VTLKPGDLLYIPRGQFHDALASKNGAVHVAFGLTYFKPIDLMSSLWENIVLNDFMRSDAQIYRFKIGQTKCNMYSSVF